MKKGVSLSCCIKDESRPLDFGDQNRLWRTKKKHNKKKSGFLFDHKALLYLGRYLYRGVIQEKDIVACQDGKVTFRYKNIKNSKAKKTGFKTITGAEFLWLVLQHVLPKGFRRARNFGFLHPNSKRLIQLLQYLLKLDPHRALARVKKRPQLTCSCCGAEMRVIKTRIFPNNPCKVIGTT